MRALIFELRPGSLADDGLVRALRTHTAAVQGRIGLPIEDVIALSEAAELAAPASQGRPIVIPSPP